MIEIPFIRPTFPGPAELAEDFEEIVDANWYTNFGPKERQFARALGEYLGPDLHVATLGVDGRKRFVARERRQDTQLHLTVARRQDQPASLRHEGSAALAAMLGAHWNVLQVGFGRRQAVPYTIPMLPTIYSV